MGDFACSDVFNELEKAILEYAVYVACGTGTSPAPLLHNCVGAWAVMALLR
jgi:hypothetical protein